MNIGSNMSAKYTQWLNSLPVAKNEANQNAGTLNHEDTANVPTSPQTTTSVDMDKILYSGEVVQSKMKNYSGTPITECEIVPSSQRDYTIGDALNYQYNKQFSFKLDDLINGTTENFKLRAPDSPVPQDFIDNLKQNGILENNYDTSRTTFYLQGLDEDTANLDHSVDYLASGYVVSKQHIEDTFTGEEKQKALNQIETNFNSAIEQIADKTAKELGGFFEENGVNGETEKIKNSIIKAYHDQIDKYSDYIETDKNYANLNGTENEWLKKDDSYMACQLRKAIKTDETSRVKESETGYYSLNELQKTKDVISEIKTSTNDISCYDDEEKIGYNLAELSLKGEVFSEFSGVSESLKNAVRKSIKHIVNNMTDELNEQLKTERAGVAEPEKLADLNKRDIFSVYNKVMDTYKTTNDMLKALIEGAAFGKNQHMSKTNSQYSNLYRYGNTGSKYWNNFFQNTLQYKTQIISLNQSDSNNGYIDKESGIEALSKEWNSFVSKFTDDKSMMLSTNSFSGYA
ncbi:hypothetical protein [Anaerotignum sp.]|uniref:hypothetical protein n=1 Tax=Anaerotignum sp. TaxID=2039241 RepID=UPI00271492F9|nr:hypothetical protein [Anaerotignum sp.]